MTWIDLADPLPRSAPEPYTPIEWELGETCSLPSTSGVPDRPFNEVIDARASHREFGFVDEQQLGVFYGWLAEREAWVLRNLVSIWSIELHRPQVRFTRSMLSLSDLAMTVGGCTCPGVTGSQRSSMRLPSSQACSISACRFWQVIRQSVSYSWPSLVRLWASTRMGAA